MAVIDTSLAPDYKLTVEDSNGVVKEVDLANALFVNSITNQLDTTSAMAVRDAVDDTATLSSHLLVGNTRVPVGVKTALAGDSRLSGSGTANIQLDQTCYVYNLNQLLGGF